MTVAAAASKDLTPQARAKAAALLRLNPDYSSWIKGASPADTDMVAFVRAATWPDQIRSTSLLESFELARKVVYKRPIGQGKGPYFVTARYKTKAGSTAETQIAVAGARSAKLLNRSLESGVQDPVSAPPLADVSTCPRIR